MSDEFADAVFGAIEAGNIDAIAGMWADDVEVWHNTDEVVQTKDQNLAVLGWMVDNTASIEYLDSAHVAAAFAPLRD